jgi:hypothetical protein
VGKGEWMDSNEPFEIESEAWYRAVAEGRLVPASDWGGEHTWPVRSPVTPNDLGPVRGEDGWHLTSSLGERRIA